MNQIEREFVHQLKKNQRIIHKICKIYADNSVDHEDLFQEITIQLWKAYPNFRGDAKFSTWMYRIALNIGMASFRKSKKTVLVDAAFEITRLSVKDEEHEDDSEKLKAMYDAIHQLSEVERALIMMYLDDKPYKEIAEILDITEGNARVKMNRAKNNLKNFIKK